MPTVMTSTDVVVIRHATTADADQLVRVAARDSQRPLDGPALIAEVDGVARAALQLGGGRVIADPFVPTADLVALLRLRAETLARPSAAGVQGHSVGRWRPRRQLVRLATLALSATRAVERGNVPVR